MPRTRRTSRISPETRFLIKQALVGVLIAISVTLLLTAVWYGTRAQALTIQTVTVTGMDTVSEEAFLEVVNEVLEGEYVRLIPRRFAYLYPEAEMQSRLYDSFPRIASVSFSVQRTTLHITAEEYVPSALWCADVESRSTCMFLDSNGFAFAPAPQLSGGTMVRFVVEGVDPVRHTYVADIEAITNMQWLIDQLAATQELYVDEVVIHSDIWHTFYLVSGGKLYVNARSDIVDTLRYFETLLRSEQYRHLKDDRFYYIDLRFGNRLYINENIPVVATSTEDEGTLTDVDIVSGQGVADSTPLEEEEDPLLQPDVSLEPPIITADETVDEFDGNNEVLITGTSSPSEVEGE